MAPALLSGVYKAARSPVAGAMPQCALHTTSPFSGTPIFTVIALELKSTATFSISAAI